MMVSSEKANMRAARAVEFAGKHKWAKYPCVAAVSVIYSAEYLRQKAVSVGESITAETERPLGMRIGAGLLSCAFTFMALPFSGITAGAEGLSSELWAEGAMSSELIEGDVLPLPTVNARPGNILDADKYQVRETEDGTLVTKKEDSAAVVDAAIDGILAEREKSEEKPAEVKTANASSNGKKQSSSRPAARPETIAEKVHLEGLPESNGDYDITLNIKTLKKDVTVRFSGSSKYLSDVEDSFAYYSIPTDDLYIHPVDVTMYSTEDRYKLNLSEGYTADITFPIPEKMMGHLDDMKVIRLEKDGSMTILDSDISLSDSGNTVSFTTEHFSVFALVSYAAGVDAENIGSGAGMTAAGEMTDMMPVSSSNVFEEDRRRFKDIKRKRKVYRIKRILRESDKLI